MCAHETPQEAARCECTGYGFGDPPCRCGYPKSQHADGAGPCLIPSARCHEFVLHIDDPFPVTLALVQASADALMVELGMEPLAAQRAAMSALFAGREHVIGRDLELRRVRAANDRLCKQLIRMDRELNAVREKEDVQPHDQKA